MSCTVEVYPTMRFSRMPEEILSKDDLQAMWEISTKMGWKKKDTLPSRIIEVMVNMAVCPIGQDGHFT